MTDEVMALEERLTRLEVIVATGFLELRQEMAGLATGLRGELGDVESRLRALIEATRDEYRTTTEAIVAVLERIEARMEASH